MQLAIVQQIFGVIFPILVVVLAGFFYARKYPIDMHVANKLNVDIFCPALIFSVISGESFHLADYTDISIAAIFIVLGSGLLILPICRVFNFSPKTLLPPIMFSNTGNLGLPLAILAFGEHALGAAMMLFVVENTLHFSVGIYLLNRRANPLAIFKIPMIAITFLGLLFSYLQVTLPTPLATSIEMLGQISIPLMLFALGVRMTKIDLSSDWKVALMGAVLTPLSGLAVFWVLTLFWDFSSQDFKYLLLFSVLPPAVLNYIISEKYRQEPHKVASVVLLGNIFAIIIIPITLFFVL